MSLFEAVFLGIIQGLTEFLPISSSGHLVIFQHLLGVNDGGLIFEVVVHFGTLLAVLAVYWKDIAALVTKPFQKYNLLLIAATVPTAIIGLSLDELFETMFTSVKVVGISLLITGVLLAVAELLARRQEGADIKKFGHAVLIGTGQALAITPGISRSGTTIALGMMLGLNRETAARFSFILSIPAILGATLLKTKDLFLYPLPTVEIIPYLVGAVCAALSGFLAIKLLLSILRKGRLFYFSIYCWLLGLIVLFVL